jgi:hypothetical protein
MAVIQVRRCRKRVIRHIQNIRIMISILRAVRNYLDKINPKIIAIEDNSDKKNTIESNTNLVDIGKSRDE